MRTFYTHSYSTQFLILNGEVISLNSRSILIYFPNKRGLNSTTKAIKREAQVLEMIAQT